MSVLKHVQNSPQIHCKKKKIIIGLIDIDSKNMNIKIKISVAKKKKKKLRDVNSELWKRSKLFENIFFYFYVI